MLSKRVAPNNLDRYEQGDVAVFENRQPVTAAKFITKGSLFILLPIYNVRNCSTTAKQKLMLRNVSQFFAKPFVCALNDEYSSFS